MSDTLETTVSMVSGMIINCTLTYFVFGVTPLFALGISCMFFCVSWCRSYAVRKLFRYMENKKINFYTGGYTVKADYTPQDYILGEDVWAEINKRWDAIKRDG